MATIPKVQSRARLGSRGSVPSFQFSTAPGRALQQLGGAVSAAAARFEERQNELDTFKVNMGLVDFEGQVNDTLRTAEENLVPGAENFHDGAIGQFDTLAQNFTGGITNPRLKQRAELRVARMRNNFSQRAAGVEAKERNRFFTGELNRAGDGFLQVLDANPGQVNDQIKAFDSLVDGSGLDNIGKTQAKRAFRQQALERSITALANSQNPEDVAKAKRLIQQLRTIQNRRFKGEDVTLGEDAIPGDLAGKEDFRPGKGRRLARGIRNNNPGNIEFGQFARRRGAVGSDGRFAQFNTPEEGVAAMASLLRGYQGRGLNTVRKMISRWAPPSENNTSAYIKRVTKAMGIGADTAFSVTKQPNLVARMIAAMIQHENGNQPYSAKQISSGVIAGLGGEKSFDQTAPEEDVARGQFPGRFEADVPTVPVDASTAPQGGVASDLPGADIGISITEEDVGETAFPANNTTASKVGDIDLARPIIRKADGTLDTEGLEVFEVGGQFVAVPTIVNGQQVTQEEAVRLVNEGQNAALDVGPFQSKEEAQKTIDERNQTTRDLRLSEFQELEGDTEPATPEEFEERTETVPIQQDPNTQQIIEAFQDGGVNLDSKAFQRLQGQIDSSVENLQEAEEEREKEEEEETFKDLYSQLASGELTVDAVQAEINTLTPSHFKQLIDAATKEGAARSEPDVLVDLLRRVDDEPLVVRDQALQAFLADQLTKQDMQTVFNRSQTEERERPQWFGTVKRFVSDSLKIPPSVGIFMSPQQALEMQSAQGKAILDFEQFMTENPGVSLSDARKRAEEIVGEARKANTASGETLSPALGIQGSVTRDKLLEARDRLRSMRDAGTISEDDAAEQAKNIQRLLSVMEAE